MFDPAEDRHFILDHVFLESKDLFEGLNYSKDKLLKKKVFGFDMKFIKRFSELYYFDRCQFFMKVKSNNLAIIKTKNNHGFLKIE